MTLDLRHALLLAAAGQSTAAVINLFLARILHWRDDIERLPLLLREVVKVHAWFISVILVIFAALTWRFATPMARGGDAACAWLAGAAGAFWALRTAIQVAYYSASHWRGRPGRTAIHAALLLAYGGMAAAYVTAALR